MAKKPSSTKHISKKTTLGGLHNDLVDKAIAVIDEILDRSSDDWEEKGYDELAFPLVVSPFFQKSRTPDTVGNDSWILCWYGSTIAEVIGARDTIIHRLAGTGLINILNDPEVNLENGHFKSDEFLLKITNRTDLIFLRDQLLQRLDKITIHHRYKSPYISIKTIGLETPKFLLNINNGTKTIFFRKRNQKTGMDMELKSFKIVVILWEGRQEEGPSGVIKKGDALFLGSIAKNCEIKTEPAAKKAIDRLNIRFKKEGVPINIQHHEDRYMLVIKKT